MSPWLNRSGLLAIVCLGLSVSCSQPDKPLAPPIAGSPNASAAARSAPNPLRSAYFGDLHLHTRNSFDAYIFNVRASPDDAYRYAKGGTIKHAAGFDLHLNSGPLDFMAVTDHSEYLGVLPAINTPGHPYSAVPYAAELFSTDQAAVTRAFRRFADTLDQGKRMPEFADLSTVRSAWADTIAAAKRHYDPGKFTTLVAYEFTSAPGGHNLHRNVIFKGDTAPNLPFTALESQNPEDLWRWLDKQRAAGMEALAIPHNSNGSDGWMFQRTKWSGEPIDRAYAELRSRNEPLAEVTQTKGTSETHPMLSPNDEFAGFEIWQSYIGQSKPITKFDGGYVRKALRDGLELQDQLGVNPYKLGMVGDSDSHNGAGAYEEDNYFSSSGIRDADPVLRGSTPPKGQTWETYAAPDAIQNYYARGAGGLTGVWAEENTRESIYAALRRRETFATTGPRIRVRFFAGYGLDGLSLSAEAGIKTAYAKGVPMGGDLIGKPGAAPTFLMAAVRDTHSAPLQRLEIVKGWTDAKGGSHEMVYDIGCSDQGKVDAKTQRCPDNGANVDLSTCAFSKDKGASQMFATWKDPDFDPRQNAFYYARVLEDPTCRWSTWDAVRNGSAPNPKVPKTIQERAYSSPIWFVPTRG